jgi:hypothetical protein
MKIKELIRFADHAPVREWDAVITPKLIKRLAVCLLLQNEALVEANTTITPKSDEKRQRALKEFFLLECGDMK